MIHLPSIILLFVLIVLRQSESALTAGPCS
eukprot:SAG31_NODE_36558_length_312_cov_0.826291_1_plen_29_part_01